jgi:phosphoribosyl 1,2-cyclic phosphodiesterase
MALQVTSLNSGSNGNCYYVGNENEAVLIDAGISCREIDRRMKKLGLSMEKVKAVFISHEHSDHIRGLTSVAHKYRLPVYSTAATFGSGVIYLDRALQQHLVPEEAVFVGGICVFPFSKFHDAADPISFLVRYKGATVGVFTDIGRPCDRVVQYFRQCHACLLEANYDEEMLERGNYPRFLKNRIRGGHGHLSNQQALDLFRAHRPEFMTHLVLTHLSNNNNTPELVSNLFAPHAEELHISIASRFGPTDVFFVTGNESPISQIVLPEATPSTEQLSLF